MKLRYGIRKKTGETYAVLKDTETGKIKSSVTLEKRTTKELGNLPELSAIQGQLASISEQIELEQVLERILDVPIGYFTEVEIVRLYNTLSDEGKNQALSYVRSLVQKEQCKNVVPISEKLYEYHVYEKCLPVSAHQFIMIRTMILFILMKN